MLVLDRRPHISLELISEVEVRRLDICTNVMSLRPVVEVARVTCSTKINKTMNLQLVRRGNIDALLRLTVALRAKYFVMRTNLAINSNII